MRVIPKDRRRPAFVAFALVLALCSAMWWLARPTRRASFRGTERVAPTSSSSSAISSTASGAVQQGAWSVAGSTSSTVERIVAGAAAGAATSEAYDYASSSRVAAATSKPAGTR